MSSQNLAKRFYKDVTTAPIEGGYSVLLDGRVLKTPGKQPLVIPREDQAKLVAAEWDAVKEKINPSYMPCTRLLNVACEQTPARRDDLVAEARKYAGTDLLCYRADALSGLRKRQEAQWDPLLEWAAELGIVLEPTTGIIAIEQKEASLDAIAKQAAAMDNLELTLLVHYIATFGSAVLGLAVLKTHISAEQAFTLSRVDEDYQIEHWGEDEDAAARVEFIRAEVLALAKLI